MYDEEDYYAITATIKESAKHIAGGYYIITDEGYGYRWADEYFYTHRYAYDKAIVTAKSLLKTTHVTNIKIDGKPFPETTSNFLDNFK